MASNQGRLAYFKAKAELCSRTAEAQMERGDGARAVENLMRAALATEQVRQLEREGSDQ